MCVSVAGAECKAASAEAWGDGRGAGARLHSLVLLLPAGGDTTRHRPLHYRGVGRPPGAHGQVGWVYFWTLHKGRASITPVSKVISAIVKWTKLDGVVVWYIECSMDMLLQ